MHYYTTLLLYRQSSVLDELTLKGEEKEKLETIIKHRLTPQPVKIRAGIQRALFRV